MAKRGHDALSQMHPGEEIPLVSSIPDDIVALFELAKLPPLLLKEWQATDLAIEHPVAYEPIYNCSFALGRSLVWQKHSVTSEIGSDLVEAGRSGRFQQLAVLEETIRTPAITEEGTLNIGLAHQRLSPYEQLMGDAASSEEGLKHVIADSAGVFQRLRMLEECMHDADGYSLSRCLDPSWVGPLHAVKIDFAPSKLSILQRQIQLIAMLNAKPRDAAELMRYRQSRAFFVRVAGKYYGTHYFYQLFNEDVINLNLIYHICHDDWSATMTALWFSQEPNYGSGFIREIGWVTKADGLARCRQGGGELIRVAIDWFWGRHSRYAALVDQEITARRECKKAAHQFSTRVRVELEKVRQSIFAKYNEESIDKAALWSAWFDSKRASREWFIAKVRESVAERKAGLESSSPPPASPGSGLG